MADNLVLQGGIWHVRLSVPADVRPFFGNRKILSASLKTGVRSEAKDLRLPYLSKWKEQIKAARLEAAKNKDRWKEEVHEQAKRKVMFLKSALGGLYDDKEVTNLNDEKTRLATDMQVMLATIQQLDDEGAPESLTLKLAEDFAGFLEGKTHPADFIKQQNDTLNEARLFLTQKKYNLSEPEVDLSKEILANPNSYKPKSPITNPVISRYSDYLDSQNDNKQTKQQLLSRLKKFSNFLTTEGKEISFESVDEFIRKISTITKTKSQYLWAGRSFWKWATKYERDFKDQFSGMPCPFDNHDLPRNEESKTENYAPFSKAEIKQLYDAAKDDEELRNLIKIGAYTGCRIEEIGRIHASDITFINGEPVSFNIPKAKTKAGKRELPVHPDLVPVIKTLCASTDGEGYLFAAGSSQFGNRISRIGRRFGKLKTKLGFSNLHTFHSIRTTTITELTEAGAEPLVIQFIAGHAVPNVTFGIYAKDAALMRAKRESLLMLDFGI